MSFFQKYYDSIRYPIEDKDNKGLRNSQIGAIHAIASHFTNSLSPAIITMPTGTGKTAVLMLSAFVLRAQRVLVVTPSRLVRTQIKDEFEKLNTLININALVYIDELPNVHELKNRISSTEKWMELKQYDVVVTTPMSISPGIEGIPNPPEDIFDLVLIDEAHHSPAYTWNEITIAFPKAKKILFTATPFRRDNKEINGKFIYNYSISDAYKEGVFGQIEYVSVVGGDNQDDILIAKKAEEILSKDKEQGLNHCLMVRTDTKPRAKQLEQIYSENTNLKLKSINSNHSFSYIRKIIKRLTQGDLDGVICVNMLGEGFNLPNLKVAAIHSPHKSLEVTLQFIGRFARTNAPNIGKAKFIAVESEVEIECKKIFEEGAVWENIILNMSESRVEEEIEKRQILGTFGCVLNKDDETYDLSLASLTPYAHVRIYSSSNFNINKDVKISDDMDIVNKHISQEQSTVVLITKEVLNPKWTKLNMFQKVQFDLFVIYYDKKSQLLFINSTRKTEEIYQCIAEQYSDNRAKKLPLSKINKVLSNLKDTEFFNIGMRNSVQASNTESYRIISGSNAHKAIKKTDGRIYFRGHCFGKGIDNNKTVTLGYSSGSKVWSNSYLSIPLFVKWCKYIVSKITNTNSVLTNTQLDFLPVSEEVKTIPPSPIISADWNKDTYLKSPVIFYEESIGNMSLINFYDIEIEIRDRIDEKVNIALVHKKFNLDIIFSLQGSRLFYSEDSAVEKVFIRKAAYDIPLMQYLNQSPLTLYFSDFSSMSGNEYYRKNYDDVINIDESILLPIEWETNNVNIKKEFGLLDSGKISIQHYLNTYLEKKEYDFLYYDHGTGEIADFISVRTNEKSTVIQFYHCKGAGGDKPGDRVEDVYEVCGQVIKSVIWTDLKKLRRKLKDRMKTHDESKDNDFKFKRDSYETFTNILDESQGKIIRFEIFLVQPGIKKSNLSEKITSVIAAADDFCVNQGYEHIKVMCSF